MTHPSSHRHRFRLNTSAPPTLFKVSAAHEAHKVSAAKIASDPQCGTGILAGGLSSTTPHPVENVGMPTFPNPAPTYIPEAAATDRLVAPTASRHSMIDAQQFRISNLQSSRCQQVVAATTKNVGMPTFPIRDSEVRP
jgi:hypothetical protein